VYGTRVCIENKENVIEKMRSGQLDDFRFCASHTGLAEDIMLAMHDKGVLNCLTQAIPDKRKDNTTVPFDLVLDLSVTAKMKTHMSLTDIPFAITDHRLLSKLGYNMIDDDNKGLMTEGSLRALVKKYSSPELFDSYNNTVQNYIMPKLDLIPNIHIADCSDIEVNLDNENYEGSVVIPKSKKGKAARGYKISSLRGIVGDTGILEEVHFSTINEHDLTISKEMLYNSPMLKPNDFIIFDRGYIDRDTLNYLKTNRKLDVYVPLKSNMDAYKMAVSTAQYENKWINHPTRKNQKIALVKNLYNYWEGEHPYENVDFNACVVWDTKATENDKKYFVFITTNLNQTAKEIVMTYTLRAEIEEEFRILKDHLNIEQFKSKNLSIISYHIICTLFAHLMFKIYTMLPEGEKYTNKILPVISKNYTPKAHDYTVFYIGNEFAILKTIEFAQIYASCEDSVKAVLNELMR